VDEWFDPGNGGVNIEEREINHVIRSALSGRCMQQTTAPILVEVELLEEETYEKGK
jgi:hypothetical protein